MIKIEKTKTVEERVVIEIEEGTYYFATKDENYWKVKLYKENGIFPYADYIHLRPDGILAEKSQGMWWAIEDALINSSRIDITEREFKEKYISAQNKIKNIFEI